MFQPLGLSTLPSHRQMLRAFLVSDPGAEGLFYVAVKTTVVFCRPTCRARKPNPHNVEFFGMMSGMGAVSSISSSIADLSRAARSVGHS